MGIEIERKFLVPGDDWRADVAEAVEMRQGYFRTGPESTVRVRRIDPLEPASPSEKTRGVLTIKGQPSEGVRPEFEYTIPPEDVERMLELFCGERTVSKVRHRLEYAGHTWVVDEFQGPNAGLVMAEVELDAPDEPVEQPPWIGEEVTDDGEYTNAALARRPMADR